MSMNEVMNPKVETQYVNLTALWRDAGRPPELEPKKWRDKILRASRVTHPDFQGVKGRSPQAGIWTDETTAAKYIAELKTLTANLDQMALAA